VKLEPSVRTPGDWIELLRFAPIALQLTGKRLKPLRLGVHLGNVGLIFLNPAPPKRFTPAFADEAIGAIAVSL
jgi:hypothetical protein